MEDNQESKAPNPVNITEQNQFAQPPVPPEALQPPQQAPRPQQTGQDTTDVLGIISLVMIFLSMSLIGVILGFIGMNKAKKEGYSPTLSQIGFWVNLVITIIGFLLICLWFVFFVLIAASSSGS